MNKKKLSIIVPCKNEEDSILETVNNLMNKIKSIDHEIILINDYSTDKTSVILQKLAKDNKKIRSYNNFIPGIGGAIKLGIKKSLGEFLTIMMADSSDDPYDLVRYYNLINAQNLDAVFGSRFTKSSRVTNYPLKKLVLNRFFNYFIKIIICSKYNDFTNAFKIYKTSSLKKIQPFISKNFNIFLEIPLKIILYNFEYKIIPINWYNRKYGVAKFKIKELGSQYLFTLFYVLIKKVLKKYSI